MPLTIGVTTIAPRPTKNTNQPNACERRRGGATAARDRQRVRREAGAGETDDEHEGDRQADPRRGGHDEERQPHAISVRPPSVARRGTSPAMIVRVDRREATWSPANEPAPYSVRIAPRAVVLSTPYSCSKKKLKNTAMGISPAPMKNAATHERRSVSMPRSRRHASRNDAPPSRARRRARRAPNSTTPPAAAPAAGGRTAAATSVGMASRTKPRRQPTRSATAPHTSTSISPTGLAMRWMLNTRPWFAGA